MCSFLDSHFHLDSFSDHSKEICSKGSAPVCANTTIYFACELRVFSLRNPFFSHTSVFRDLSGNRIRDIPDCLGSLHVLMYVSLANNDLMTLPISFDSLPLVDLNIDGNYLNCAEIEAKFSSPIFHRACVQSSQKPRPCESPP